VPEVWLCVPEGGEGLREEVIEIAKDKRLVLRLYEEDGLLALIVQKRYPFTGQEGWITKEHVTLRPDKAEELKRALEKLMAKGRGKP